MNVTVVDRSLPLPAMSAIEEEEYDVERFVFDRERSSSTESDEELDESDDADLDSDSVSSASSSTQSTISRTTSQRSEPVAHDDVATLAGHVVNLERKLARLTAFKAKVDKSIYFDKEDGELVDAEVQRTKTTLRDLIKPLSERQTTRLNLYRTLAFREQLLEEAVQQELLVPDVDSVFASFVKKQVQLTKIVNDVSK